MSVGLEIEVWLLALVTLMTDGRLSSRQNTGSVKSLAPLCAVPGRIDDGLWFFPPLLSYKPPKAVGPAAREPPLAHGAISAFGACSDIACLDMGACGALEGSTFPISRGKSRIVPDMSGS